MTTETLICNLYGGPSSGKSTTAAHLFALLKLRAVSSELVTEAAKDHVWDDLGLHPRKMRSLHLFSEQVYRLERLIGKVRVVVTDSPILLNIVYGKSEHESFMTLVQHEYFKMTNLNIFIERVKTFSQRGRIQNEEESIQIDKEISDVLEDMGLLQDTLFLPGDASAAERIDWHLKNRMSIGET